MTDNCPKCKSRKIRIRGLYETSPEGRSVYVRGMLDVEVTCYGCGMVKRIPYGDFDLSVKVKEEALYE